MSKYTIEDTTLTAIADKLREASGETEPITPEEMPEKIAGVFDAGSKSEYDRFWDAFQQNGDRTDYAFGFAGLGWNADTFKPKYSLFPTSARYMFANALTGLDLAAALRENNIVLDCSECTTFDRFFNGKSPVTCPVIDTRSASVLNNMFIDSGVQVIDALILRDDGSQNVFNLFNYARYLRSIAIEGVIGTSMDARYPTFDHDSLLSILHALKDYSGDTSGTEWKVTLGDVNLAKLSEDDIAIAEEKGWVLA